MKKRRKFVHSRKIVWDVLLKAHQPTWHLLLYSGNVQSFTTATGFGYRTFWWMVECFKLLYDNHLAVGSNNHWICEI
eukprot:14714801-Ditylum_brightwellii.AAC.1